jgi:hypothetical protein
VSLWELSGVVFCAAFGVSAVILEELSCRPVLRLALLWRGSQRRRAEARRSDAAGFEVPLTIY